MILHDVTLTLQPDMPTWPGEPGPSLSPIHAIAKGDGDNVSLLTIGAHTGTHIDAPYHFIPTGATIETLPLEVLIGPALVLHLDVAEQITAATLEAAKIPEGAERLFFRTSNSDFWAKHVTAFQQDFVALGPDAAQWLVERGVRLVGVDYLSVESYHASEPLTHRTLLSAGVVIVEGVNLTGIAAGDYQAICLPLKLAGADGCPARVVLIDEGEGGKG